MIEKKKIHSNNYVVILPVLAYCRKSLRKSVYAQFRIFIVQEQITIPAIGLKSQGIFVCDWIKCNFCTNNALYFGFRMSFIFRIVSLW